MGKNVNILPISLTYSLGAQKNRLNEMVLLSTHNICLVEKLENKVLITHAYLEVCKYLGIIFIFISICLATKYSI